MLIIGVKSGWNPHLIPTRLADFLRCPFLRNGIGSLEGSSSCCHVIGPGNPLNRGPVFADNGRDESEEPEGQGIRHGFSRPQLLGQRALRGGSTALASGSSYRAKQRPDLFPQHGGVVFAGIPRGMSALRRRSGFAGLRSPNPMLGGFFSMSRGKRLVDIGCHDGNRSASQFDRWSKLLDSALNSVVIDPSKSHSLKFNHGGPNEVKICISSTRFIYICLCSARTRVGSN